MLHEDDMEIWKSVVGYEGTYEVSNFGRVKSIARIVKWGNQWGDFSRALAETILKPFVCNRKNSGHLIVSLNKGNTKKSGLVHRLVLEAFVGPCPEGMEACHFPDRDPTNNRLDNLRWATHADNEKDKDAHGMRPVGSAIRTAKLNEDQVREIRKLQGVATQEELAKRFGVSRYSIQRIHYRRGWKHV